MSEHGDAHARLLEALRGDKYPSKTIPLPPAGWGAAVNQGSANIPLMNTVAAYVFGIAAARTRLIELGKISRSRFMLSEPLSSTYSDWHVLSWILALWTARRRADKEVEAALYPLCAQWFGLAALSSAICPKGNLNEDEKKYVGQKIVAFAGCRSWGHHHGLGMGHHETFRVAVGAAPKGANQSSWEGQVRVRCLPLLREFGFLFKGLTPDEIVAKIPRFSMREDFQFLAYADGSRVCIMGTDEPELEDEDSNSNTLGFLAFIVDQGRGRVDTYPEWPAPNSGATRIRQTAAFADVDRDALGWVLYHSHIGRKQAPDSRLWITKIAAPTAPLVSAWRAPKDGGAWVNLMGGAPGVPGGSPSAGSPGIPPPAGDSGAPPLFPRRSWFERFLDWLGL